MMTTTAHLFVALLTIPCLLFIAVLVRRGHLRAKYSFLWLGIGSFMVLLVSWPNLLNRLSAVAGIAYGPTLLFVCAIMLLLLIAMHFSWEISRLEERTRRLAEELALARADKQRETANGGPA